ncbi:MAG: hypothetical protein HY293_22385 [Planctomycetes bacterium]|nr:hypothetical protein [Planctomycetota bacterium]
MSPTHAPGFRAPVEGLDAGADDHVMKPFSARELPARVKTHLDIARIRREAPLDLERLSWELDGFSTSVSHDLRAPLRAIEGFSRMLVEDHSKALDAEGRRIETSRGALPPAIGDLALLRQALTNLIAKAVKYTGRLDVAHIEVGGEAGPECHTCWVTDDGAGFPME